MTPSRLSLLLLALLVLLPTPATAQTDPCAGLSNPGAVFVAPVGRAFTLGWDAPYPPAGTSGSQVMFSIMEGTTIIKNLTEAEVQATPITAKPGCYAYQAPAPAFTTPGDRQIRIRAYLKDATNLFTDSNPITLRVFNFTAPVNLRAIVTVNSAGQATLQVYVPDRTSPIASSTIDLTQLLLGQLIR